MQKATARELFLWFLIGMAVILFVSELVEGAELYPPPQHILPGEKITESMPIQNVSGTPGILRRNANGITIFWAPPPRYWWQPTAWDKGRFYFWEPNRYRAYCRHQCTDEEGVTHCITDCITWHNEQLVYQVVERWGEEPWVITLVEDISTGVEEVE